MKFNKTNSFLIIILFVIFVSETKTISEGETVKQKRHETIELKSHENQLHSLGCTNCHTFQGPLKRISLRERKKIKGPNLWIAGNKYQKKY